jgi:hypothetical protein
MCPTPPYRTLSSDIISQSAGPGKKKTQKCPPNSPVCPVRNNPPFGRGLRSSVPISLPLRTQGALPPSWSISNRGPSTIHACPPQADPSGGLVRRPSDGTTNPSPSTIYTSSPVMLVVLLINQKDYDRKMTLPRLVRRFSAWRDPRLTDTQESVSICETCAQGIRGPKN